MKRVKMDKENQGFPTTAMREIQVLLRMKHPNIVNLQEVIVGKTMDWYARSTHGHRTFFAHVCVWARAASIS